MDIIRFEPYHLLKEETKKDFSYQEYFFCEYSLFETKEISFEIDETSEKILNIRINSNWLSIIKEEKWLINIVNNTDELEKLAKKSVDLDNKYIKLNNNFENLWKTLNKKNNISFSAGREVWLRYQSIETSCILTESKTNQLATTKFDEVAKKVKIKVEKLEKKIKELEEKLEIYNDPLEKRNIKLEEILEAIERVNQ